MRHVMSFIRLRTCGASYLSCDVHRRPRQSSNGLGLAAAGLGAQAKAQTAETSPSYRLMRNCNSSLWMSPKRRSISTKQLAPARVADPFGCRLRTRLLTRKRSPRRRVGRPLVHPRHYHQQNHATWSTRDSLATSARCAPFGVSAIRVPDAPTLTSVRPVKHVESTHLSIL